ncbi:MAG: Hint domain-containing protein [Pseudomonadota bacterium]
MGMGVGAGGAFISTVYADNNAIGGGTEIDLDGDGNPTFGGGLFPGATDDGSNSDEFITISNDSGTPTDIGGFEVYVNGEIYHQFPAGTTIPANGEITIVTFWANASTPGDLTDRGTTPSDSVVQANGGDATLDPRTEGAPAFTINDTVIPDNANGTGASGVVTGGDATIALVDGSLQTGGGPVGAAQADNAFVVTYEPDPAPGGFSGDFIDGIDNPINTLGTNPNASINIVQLVDASGAGTFPEAGVQIDITVDGTITEPPVEFVCFARGTRIATPKGTVPIEEISAGDRIITVDGGARRVRWIGSTTISAQRLAEERQFHPVRIKAGALGRGLPERDLLVSQQHRMVLSGWRAEVMFGEPEVLAAAKHLVNGDTIFVDESVTEVQYFHILFDNHEIILAEGAPSESFHPGESSIRGIDRATRDEILALFPALAEDHDAYGPAARLSLKPHEVRSLVA